MVIENLKVAFVQDALPYQGGAEKVLAAALDVFPQAPIYTLVYNQDAFRGTVFEQRQVITSFIDRLPGKKRHHKLYLPVMPMALGQFDFSGYDIVMSFSYAVAHAAPTSPGQLHISYIHTPLRYAWNEGAFGKGHSGVERLPAWILRPFFGLFRRWDRAMAGRTNYFLTNSRWMAGRIWDAYKRPAEVLYPPVDTNRFYSRSPRENYYIAVSRLVGHKRLDLVVDAFSRLRYPLLVVGEGPKRAELQARSAPNIQFLGWQSAESLAHLLGGAKAFVHAGQEDFGIAMTEAQAAGCPVIALRRGGASEIVMDGQTGILFDEQNVESLCDAIEQFERYKVEWGAGRIRAGAQRFNWQNFQKGLERFVVEKWAARNDGLVPYVSRGLTPQEFSVNTLETPHELNVSP